MNKISTIFFGTHDFAATILQGLTESPFLDIALVVTQPDRPVGRKQELQPSPVKLMAEKYGLPLAQPESLKKNPLPVTNADLGICAQYGLIIPKTVLDLPTHGVLNVHTSLLPKHRGASPIQTAIRNGETETGVTIMLMDEGLDTGPILLQKTCTIAPDDTYQVLDQKLALLGQAALLEAIPLYIEGKITPQAQNSALATSTAQLSRDDGKINWSCSGQAIYNTYRAFMPWPGVWTMWQGKRIKLLTILPSSETGNAPGAFFIRDQRLFIGCGQGSLEILTLQMEGKTVMDAQAFVNGHPILRQDNQSIDLE